MTVESPSLPELVQVVHSKDGDFSSKLVSLVDRQPGQVLAPIQGAVLVNQRAYTSVQVSEDVDCELNSDLVYANHSCDPSVVFDMAKLEVRVVAGQPLKKGQDVTFFYPSTEWDMQQPFDCHCANGSCLGKLQGARYLKDDVLRKYWLSPHICRLVEKRVQDAKHRMGINGNSGDPNGAVCEV